MGHITRDDTAGIAHLARIALTDEEIDTFSGQLESVLGLMDRLREVDVEGVAPFVSAAGDDNVFRADVASAGFPVEKTLQNAPEREGNHFRVPRVTGD